MVLGPQHNTRPLRDSTPEVSQDAPRTVDLHQFCPYKYHTDCDRAHRLLRWSEGFCLPLATLIRLATSNFRERHDLSHHNPSHSFSYNGYNCFAYSTYNCFAYDG